MIQALINGPVFDGTQLHEGQVAVFEAGTFTGLEPKAPSNAAVIDLEGDILSPGYVDLQVNGGGGVMFNDVPCVATLTRIAQAHRQLGSAQILPTLITDTPGKTAAAIQAVQEGIAQNVPGIAGLHLEGPHLSVARKGAHDAAYIRPMTDADLHELITAKQSLPVLKITLAPESATPAQVSALCDAGVLVALGHTDADFDTCMTFAKAGARCVTHLFNAMSQLGNRAPGLVGAALQNGELSAGLIADGVHVHPAVMRAAWDAKTAPGQIFLVSDAMAVAGTNMAEFQLDGRVIHRQDGQLRLADGTLAGADLDLTTAIRILTQQVGVSLPDALAAATRVPAHIAGIAAGRLVSGRTLLSDLIRIRADLTGAKALAKG